MHEITTLRRGSEERADRAHPPGDGADRVLFAAGLPALMRVERTWTPSSSLGKVRQRRAAGRLAATTPTRARRLPRLVFGIRPAH